MREAKKKGYAYVVLDGMLIPIDRVAADRPFYSGKHKKHGMNLQVIASPDGGPVGLRAAARLGARQEGRVDRGVLAHLEAAGLIVLADKGYRAPRTRKSRTRARTSPESQKAANRAHAKLRAPGERANAQLKNWHILRKLRCCPWRAGRARRGHPRPGNSRGFRRMERVS